MAQLRDPDALRSELHRFSSSTINSEYSSLIDVTSGLANVREQLDTRLWSTAPFGSSPSPGAIKEIKKTIAFGRGILAEAVPGEVFKALHSLTRRLSSISEGIHVVLGTTPGLLVASLTMFEVQYNEWLASKPGMIPYISRTAGNIQAELSLLNEVANGGIAALGRNYKVVRSASTLRLGLEIETEANTVANKLAVLAALYSELLDILKESEREKPLRVELVESGSLWLTLIGSAGGLTLLKHVATSGMRWVYAHSTQEGRLRVIPASVKAAEDVIGLRNSLKAMGRDTAAVDEALDSSAAKIARQLNVLIEDVPSAVVDGVTFEIAPEERKTLRQPEPPKLLGPGTGEDSEE